MIPSGSVPKAIDTEELAKAFDNPPNKLSAIALELVTTQKCLVEGLGRNTAEVFMMKCTLDSLGNTCNLFIQLVSSPAVFGGAAVLTRMDLSHPLTYNYLGPDRVLRNGYGYGYVSYVTSVTRLISLRLSSSNSLLAIDYSENTPSPPKFILPQADLDSIA
ncbi:hypothetical protein B0H14DRAFT_3470511 [Mycena olivaceomarginata]|nr:hypothetical protein B0H14DRAFT_3470511 [Mycena olivaceomarginata]